MLEGMHGYRFILVLLCEVFNFLVACPLRTTKTEEVCEAILNSFIKYFGSPTHIICDQDPAFTSSLCNRFAELFDIYFIFVSPTNHKSLQAEHGIKSIASMLMKHLADQGTEWPMFCGLAMLNHNSSNTPNLDGLSPTHLVLGHRMRLVPELEISPSIPLSGTFMTYFQKLNKRVQYLRDRLYKFRDIRHDLQNSDKPMYSFFGRTDCVHVPPCRSSTTDRYKKDPRKVCGPSLHLQMHQSHIIYSHVSGWKSLSHTGKRINDKRRLNLHIKRASQNST